MFKPSRSEVVSKVEELVKTKKFKEYLDKSKKSIQVRLNGYNTFFKHNNHISALRFTLNQDMETFTVALDHRANGYLVDLFPDIKMPKPRAKKDKTAETKSEKAVKEPSKTKAKPKTKSKSKSKSESKDTKKVTKKTTKKVTKSSKKS